MTPWDRLRDRVGDTAVQDRRRGLLVGVAVLLAIALALVVSPWAIWPLASAAIWLAAIGVVVFAAVRVALRNR